VIVGPREALRARAIFLRDLNWLVSPRRLECAVKVRSTRPPVLASVTPMDDGAWVELLGFEEAVAPGQACVFYESDGTRVLGGGTIARSKAARAAA
jgi:tRNA-uridine 2-sulfurtransferase